MTFRKTLTWLLVLLLVAAVAGGGAAYWLFLRSDELLRDAVLAEVSRIAPHCRVEIGRARFDWNRRVHLDDVTIGPRDDGGEVVRVPEVVVSIDREAFAESQTIDIRRVRIREPRIALLRDASGHWNWQDLLPIHDLHRGLPEWVVEGARVRIGVAHGEGTEASAFELRDGELRFVPSGQRVFVVRGSLNVGGAGSLAVEGQWNLDRHTWSMNGTMAEVVVEAPLLQSLAALSPELQTRLGAADQVLRRFAARLSSARRAADAGSARSTAPRPLAPSPPRSPAASGLAALEFQETVDLDLRVSRWDAEAPPEFKLHLDLKGGHVRHPVLPFVWHELTGEVYCDNRQVLVREWTARNGVTEASVEGRLTRTEGRFDIAVRKLPLDDRLRGSLPAELLKTFDDLRPTGHVDVTRHWVQPAGESWRLEESLLTTEGATFTHAKFPYRITDVSGWAKQQRDDVSLRFTGRAAGRPVRLDGELHDPGPAVEATFDIRTESLPLDGAFRAACPPAARRAQAALRLEGEADWQVRLHRPAGVGERFRMRLLGRVRNASVQPETFPYRLSRLQGRVSYDGDERIWRFDRLEAAHDTARLSGRGVFRLPERRASADAPGTLTLDVAVRGALFDEQLRLALPQNLQALWDELSPSGTLDAAFDLQWVPGRPVGISLPVVRVTDGRMTMQSFPYPLKDVEAKLSYADGRVDIASFTGWHEETRLRADGFARFSPDGQWRLRLEEIFIDDLVPDRAFRRSLPGGLRGMVDGLNPQGPLSLSGMLEFRGTGRADEPVTSAWDVETVLTGNRVTAGMDLDNVHGRVTTRGTWDGQRTRLSGSVDLDSLAVRGYQLTQVRGPFRLDGQSLVVGSDEPFRTKPKAVPPEQRMTAHAIDGVLTLDAVARLDDEVPYHIKASLSQGRLEQYARRYLADARNLQGAMNGWLDLRGKGTSTETLSGHGQLQISPAALYEVPVMVQIFKVLSFVPPDKTAFVYAFFDFDVARGEFVFDKIDLVGDAISLRGRGTARLDGTLALDFYSMLSRKQVSIPLVSTLLGEATKGWVGVQVRGKVSAPKAVVKPAPQLDETLGRFLGAFEPRPPRQVPRLLSPPSGTHLTQPRRRLFPRLRQDRPQR